MRALSRTDLWWLGAAVLLAVVLRLVWTLYATADPGDGRFDDSVFYHHVAANLANGGAYTSPWTGNPTAQWAPGYPLFLTPLYWLFGSSVTVAELANVGLGAATVVVLYLLALQLFDSRAARIAVVLLAVFPGQVLFASLVYSETLFTFLFVLGLLLSVIARERAAPGGWYWVLAFGLVAGAAALVRGAGLSLLLIGPAYWLLSGRDWRTSLRWGALRWSALALAAAVLTILPWTARNIQTMDSPLLITSSSGINFWQGHNAGTTGSDDQFPRPLFEKYGSLAEVGGEVAVNNGGLREGLRYAVTHPGQEALFVFKKFRALYLRGDLIAFDLNEDRGKQPFIASGLRSTLRAFANVFYYGVFAVAGLAVVRAVARRDPVPLLPLTAITVVTLGHIVVFMGGPRYHFPLVPLFCLLAAWGLAALPVFRATPKVAEASDRGAT